MSDNKDNRDFEKDEKNSSQQPDWREQYKKLNNQDSKSSQEESSKSEQKSSSSSENKQQYSWSFKSEDNNHNQNNNRNKGNGFSVPKVNLKDPKFKLGFTLVPAALVIVAALSGFYTVNESERGVVQRLGAYHSETSPGLNWKLPVVDDVTLVNVQRVSELRLDGTMLTKDENVVNVSLTVQYRISEPRDFLFNVDDPLTSLKEASESSLRYVIGHMGMDEILTTGRGEVREQTRSGLVQVLDRYKLGVEIVDVNFQSARPPEAVKEAFDDAIKAQEDEQRYIREAEAYKRAKEPIARGEADQIIAQAESYAREIITQAQGEQAQFNKLLPEFLQQPLIFKQRYYLDTISNIYANTPKVVLQDGVNLNFLSLDKILGQRPEPENYVVDPIYQPSSIGNSSALTKYPYTLPNSTTSQNYTTSNNNSSSTNSTTNSNNTSREAPSRFVGNRTGGSK